MPLPHIAAATREIHEGLNVIESWNNANDFIFFGKGGEMASNRVDDQEISMLSLHLLQLALVYVNTLMIQQILAEPTWTERLNANDLRGITRSSTPTSTLTAASGSISIPACPSTRRVSAPRSAGPQLLLDLGSQPA